MEFFIFIIGLVFGSFANVCIYRIPKDLSIINLRSFCPECKSTIKWYNNIPLISFIILKGRCRDCGTKISIVYPLVELLTAILFLLIYKKVATCDILSTDSCLIFFIFAWILIVVSFIDYKHRIIPDVFSFLLIAIGLATSFFNVLLGEKLLSRLLNSLAGVVGGIGLGIFISYIGEKIFKKEAFGGGDIKLLSGIGAFLGIKDVFYTLFYASFIGGVFSIILILLKKIKKDDYIPFGPFISIAAIFLLLIK